MIKKITFFKTYSKEKKCNALSSKYTSHLSRATATFLSQVTHPESIGRCLEKSGILEMAAERRRNSLADYPIIRFSGTFAIYVSEFYPFLSLSLSKQARGESFPFLCLSSTLVFVSTSRGKFRFHLAKVVFRASTPSCHMDPWSRVLMRIAITAIVDLHEPGD